MRLVLDTNLLIAALVKESITRCILLLPGLEFLLSAFALDELATHGGKIVRAARLKGDERDSGAEASGTFSTIAAGWTIVKDCRHTQLEERSMA
jgi:hypothetical protein